MGCRPFFCTPVLALNCRRWYKSTRHWFGFIPIHGIGMIRDILYQIKEEIACFRGKLMSDEELIALVMADGATREEAIEWLSRAIAYFEGESK